MSKIERLSSQIMRDGKMNPEALVKFLSESIGSKDEHEVYEELYSSAYGKTISKDLAEEWVKSMDVTDGSDRTSGEKWTMEECYDVGTKISVDWKTVGKPCFFIVMNMMYSDYYKTAAAFSMQNDPNFFGRLAKDWLCDTDTAPDKLYNYYFHVVS